MATPPEDFASGLTAARSGSNVILGQMLEACRGYLYHVAQAQLDPALQAKVSPSDLVQDTFLEAQRDFAQFRGNSEAELLGWLRQLLLHNLANVGRRFQGTAKRSIAREVPLAEYGSGAGLSPLEANTASPSEYVASLELAAALAIAIEELPDDYREVIHLRYHDQRSFEEIAVLMQRSTNATRKLWARAVERLQESLEVS